jgi:nitroreductase
VLFQLIEAAVWAPSALNEQPWHFTVVQNQQKLDTMIFCHALVRIRGLCQPGRAMDS